MLGLRKLSRRMSGIDPDARENDWHLVMPGGDHLTPVPAAIALLVEIKRTRWIGRLLGWLRTQWLAGVVVSLLVTWLRPHFGSIRRGRAGISLLPAVAETTNQERQA